MSSSKINLIYCQSKATVKDQKENDVIHSQGLDFNVGKSFASEPPSICQSKSIRSPTPEKTNHRSSKKPTQLSQTMKIFLALNRSASEIHDITAVGKLEKIKPWFGLEFQPNILCRSILSFSALEDEPLLLPLSPKLVFSSATSFCFCILLNDRGETPLPAAGTLLTSLSTTFSTESQHDLHNQTYFSTWLFLKELCNQVTKDLYSLKIRLNLCTNYNQHTTGISSIYEKFKRKPLHPSATETLVIFFFFFHFHFFFSCSVVESLCLQQFPKGLRVRTAFFSIFFLCQHLVIQPQNGRFFACDFGSVRIQLSLGSDVTQLSHILVYFISPFRLHVLFLLLFNPFYSLTIHFSSLYPLSTSHPQLVNHPQTPHPPLTTSASFFLSTVSILLSHMFTSGPMLVLSFFSIHTSLFSNSLVASLDLIPFSSQEINSNFIVPKMSSFQHPAQNSPKPGPHIRLQWPPGWFSILVGVAVQPVGGYAWGAMCGAICVGCYVWGAMCGAI
ncbi:hypothetical protein VP01_1875g3 [Puccinia sorghi]|uniref:Uncharacterized protein n=1 Tax=Puccinia sorghi TaxID=27349 RepID=A0A0L6VD92_9BASI|nr:hypothetical protein VP01_1875g3 [Puccinia sorghi]